MTAVLQRQCHPGMPGKLSGPGPGSPSGRSFDLCTSHFDLRATGALAVQERDLNADGDFLDDDEVVYYHSSTPFSIYGLSDADENVIERYRFDAYGAATVLDADFSDDADNASDVDNPYTFTARWLDSESGLMQYRYRYYWPPLGRFVSWDRLIYVDSYCLFAYANNRPAYFCDPLGGRYLLPPGTPPKLLPPGKPPLLLPAGPGAFKRIVKRLIKGGGLIRLVACCSCGVGSLGIEGICAIYTDDAASWLDCVCSEVGRNKAWKYSCNACVAPLSFVFEVRKALGCP